MSAIRERLVCVAQVAGAHGVRGALKLRCFTERPGNVARYGPLLDARGREMLRPRVIGSWRGGVIVAAEGIPDRDAAEALRGQKLYVPRSALPPPGEDEYYHEDLVGLRAIDRAGEWLGEVLAVHDYGAGPLLEIGHGGRDSLLLPFTRETVPEIDPGRGHLVVVPPVMVEAAAGTGGEPVT